MTNDDWEEIDAFSTAQDAVLLLDPIATCSTDGQRYWVSMAKGCQTISSPRMDAAWDLAIEFLMELFAEPTHGSMLDRVL